MFQARLLRDIRQLTEQSLKCEGFDSWAISNDQFLISFEAPSNTPYHPSTLYLSLRFPNNTNSSNTRQLAVQEYPFEPPEVLFQNPIPFHPNIDPSNGAICLDLLKRPPNGTWRPSVALSSLLCAIRLLLCEPNPDDPFCLQAAHLYRTDLTAFAIKARDSVLSNQMIQEEYNHNKRTDPIRSSSLLARASKRQRSD